MTTRWSCHEPLLSYCINPPVVPSLPSLSPYFLPPSLPPSLHPSFLSYIIFIRFVLHSLHFEWSICTETSSSLTIQWSVIDFFTRWTFDKPRAPTGSGKYDIRMFPPTGINRASSDWSKMMTFKLFDSCHYFIFPVQGAKVFMQTQLR